MPDQNTYNHQIIEAFRANRGKTDGPFAASPLLLLTTTGARSGLPRTSPLRYIPDGDQLLVLASNYGAPKHPDWYHNLLVHPNVTVEVGSETYRATAATLVGIAREQAWTRLVERYPSVAALQTKTPRQIPLVALKR
ncbi:MAG TPA: nitroreductase family deazaflavin-dependent oxidoreductase [Ktedonobacteraceae bacterium]